MSFASREFVLLLVATLVLLFAVRRVRWQNLCLLAISYYFYAYWDWRFLGLILLSTVVDYVIGLRLERCDVSTIRKWWLAASMIVNLGLLGVFKYCNFFIDNLRVALEPFGLNLQHLSIVLPVGISFYTFQTMSYTVDVYRRQLPACRSFVDFALFVSFFPQLVAGPIVRASELLPQIQRPRQLSSFDMLAGFRQFTIGLFKKVFIADNLAPYVDFQFENAGLFDAPSTWLAVTAYTIQIYCDFSGYSDMAIGTARMIGFHFSENFRLPYLSMSITEFWRRWHISLSSWLRDYLYIPLGGNRHGRVRTYVNLMLTMLLGGLWHGASWNFAIWGLLHGSALSLHRRWRGRGEPIEQTASPAWYRLAAWTTTMLIVTSGWVLFRAASWQEAALIFRQLLGAQAGFHHLSPFALLIVVGFFVHHSLIVLRWTESLRLPLELPLSSRLTPAALFTMLLLTLLHWPEAYQPFIYFQF